jgi:hypothetical protein
LGIDLVVMVAEQWVREKQRRSNAVPSQSAGR